MEAMRLEDTLKRLGVTKENENGRVIYRQEDGDVIDTYTENIELIMDYCLDRLDYVFQLAEGDEELPTGALYSIGQALIRDSRNQVKQISHFIRENFGFVDIERAMYGQRGIEGGTHLGVKFEPAKKEAPDTNLESE